MKKTTPLIFALLLALCGCVSQGGAKSPEKRYELHCFDVNQPKTYKWNYAYPAYYLRYSLVAVFSVDKIIPAAELIAIEKDAIYALSQGKRVKLLVRDYQDGKDITFVMGPFLLANGQDTNSLLFFCNYDFTTKKVVNVKTEMTGREYAVALNTINEKLVKLTKMYSEKAEKDLVAAGNPNNLADFYIYDERDDNDAQVEGLIAKDLELHSATDDKNLRSKSVAMATYAEYCIIHGNFPKAKELLASAAATLSAAKEKSNVDRAIQITEGELALVESIAADPRFAK
jgi:hypothetical protein